MSRTALTLLALAVVSCGAPSLADEPRLWNLAFEAGVRGGGDVEAEPLGTDADVDPRPSFAVTADRRLGSETAFEFGWHHYEASFDVDAIGDGSFGVDVDTLLVGTTYRPRRKGARPFVSASVGMSRFGAERGGFDDETRAAFVLGGGVSSRLTDRLRLRWVGRGWFYLGDTRLEGVCGAETCTVRLFAGGGFQFEGAVGLVVALGR